MTATDWLGRPIEPGTLITYPVREGSRMDVVLARVRYQRNTGELEVERIRTSGSRPLGRRKRGVVRALDRVTVVDTDVLESDT